MTEAGGVWLPRLRMGTRERKNGRE
ncbi:hypothetical protein E2C01_085208 [Portunus trituberculatus]|uniref:Uncharacterized protein n=1 Tax=Portunus trituberculatus TaxID=210409 RepID=A0A5B7JCY9_PORTR|nr:hypothetical protein [Portunus trituberculatus]